MSSTALWLSIALVACAFGGLIAYVVIGSRRNARNKGAYRWEPAQDYDIVMDQETPMTPPYPKLRRKTGGEPKDEELRRW